MALTGYPVEDLALRRSFVDASRQTLDTLAARLATEGLGELVVVVGYLDGAPDAVPVLGTPKGAPQNAAAVVHRGRVAARYAKHHLPNYGVFDEYRYFVPGRSLTVARVHGADVAIAICEDIWQEGGPVAGAREAGAGLLLVINGSPYERNKDDVRLDLAVRRAAGAGCALAYVNMVGGQDELVFDGDSLVVAADGTLLARAAQFETELLAGRPGPARRALRGRVAADVERVRALGRPAAGLGAGGGTGRGAARATRPRSTAPWCSACATTCARTASARVRARPVRRHRLGAGRRDRLRRGRARRTCTASRCRATTPPTHSRADAADLAERTGLVFQTVPIAPMVGAFLRALA